MSRLRVNLAALALLSLSLVMARVAAADAPRVLLVRPMAAAREVKTALVRVEGELVADGFEVVSVEAATGTTSEEAMNQAENQGSSTTVGLFLSADGANAELWVVDHLTNKTVVRRVTTGREPHNLLPEVLALKAVVLLRASLLELVVERSAAASQAPALPAATRHASDWAARPLRAPTPTWALETGAAVIWSPGQIDPAFESLARMRFVVTQNLQLRLSVMGLGTRPQVRGNGGSALLAQWSGLLEALLIPFPQFLLRPSASLGAGVFRPTVSGEAVSPYQGVHSSRWAFAADGSLGLSLPLASRLELAAEGHALWAAPRQIVHFVAADGPSVGYPAVVGSLTLLGWL